MIVLPSRHVLLLFMLVAGIFTDSIAQQLINQRQLTLLEKARRPNDPWPRGDAHVVLATPGSPLSQKGYHEPGGSFSPSPGSFGIAIWVLDAGNNLVATSDNIPMEQVQQSYQYFDNAVIPALATVTPYYTCTWRHIAEGKWELAIKQLKSNQTLQLVMRSAGPAGGPVNSVVWDSTRLLVNRRWLLSPSGHPFSMAIGDEEAGELLKTIPRKESVLSENGWGFAKLGISGQEFSLTVVDTKPQFAPELSYSKTIQQFELQVPDEQFTQSLQAQIANLMMGYIGRQTGPGEPINYPLAWERDGAYSLVAMAKSGQLETARQLSVYFAENDFFGGFGAEGDAPGSAINALTEVAFLLNDPGYTSWLWPHIKRKLAIIDEMMNANAEVYKNFIGPLAPHIATEIKRRSLICRKTEDGLIIGTMDNHFPALYINAISYRGLVQASRLADYLKDSAMAGQCLRKAAMIKTAWANNFGKKKYDNERNFMISVWPSWITNKDNNLFREKIAAKHQEEWGNADTLKERPLWTYFTAAEAHQWLFLDEPGFTWKTVQYFWNHQTSPGLYTFWEGNGEENTFRQWEHYRGWLNPKYITPHYWTASEMTLLQLDMLTYIDESKDDYQLVIGAGVPDDWLNHTISIKNYRTKAGIISWEYSNHHLRVTVKGAARKYTVRPGVNFQKANTRLTVIYK